MPIEPHDNQAGNIALLREQLRLGLTIVSETMVYQATDWVTGVHAADIDNDGDIELLLGSRDGMLHILTKRGDIKWKRSLDSGWSEWIGAVFGQAYPRSKTRIIAGARNGSIYALDKSGELLWHTSIGDAVRQVLVADINNDSRAEVVAGSEDMWVYAFDYETGREIWKCPTQGWIRTIAVCDVDGDGEVEVLAGSGDKSLYVISGQSGQHKQTFFLGQKMHALFAYDVDQDGVIEILVGTDKKDLFALKPNGQEKWRMFPPPDNRILALDVADINNDGHNEIIAASEDMHIYFLDAQGKLLWRHYLGIRPIGVHAVDLDRDGLVEILVGAQDNSLHVLRVDLAENLKALRHNILSAYKRVEASSLLSQLSQTEAALLEDLVRKHDREGPFTIARAKRFLRQHRYTDALPVFLRLREQRVQPLWKKSKNVGHIRSLCFGNIAADTHLELVVGTDEGEIQVLNAHGALVWLRPLPDQRIVMLQMGDLDGDGEPEVIACTYNRRIYLLNSRGKFNGKPMQEWIACIYMSQFVHAEQLRTEIIMGSRDNKITIYNSQLDILEVIPTLQGIKMICAYDLNGDGIPEIIAGTDDRYVHAYTRNGEKLWEYRTWDRVNALRVKDIDADGLPEIVVGSEDRNVHVLDYRGHLKWRYYTPHRVLDVDAYDVDQDGKVEVLIGDGDAYMYVLSGQGDLLWKYRTNDRVRVVQAEDVNKDGITEIALGSEDRLHLLQLVHLKPLELHIEQCWAALTEGRPARACISDLCQQSDAYLRAFALEKLAALPDLCEDDLDRFETISKESSLEERIAFAYAIPLIYRVSPLRSQQYLHLLAIDPIQDVQLALISCFPALTEADPAVSFEWLKRFSRNSNRWIRRACIRQLSELTPIFPKKAFALLTNTAAQHEIMWIQQESARALAHYCDLYPDEVVVCAFTLLSERIRPTVFQQIAHSATKLIAQRLFQALFHLLDDLNGVTLVIRTEAVMQALGEACGLDQGEANWQLYREFYRAGKLRTIHEIARYSVEAEQDGFVGDARLLRSLEYLKRLAPIARNVRLYLKREILLDRLTSLLSVEEALKRANSDLNREGPGGSERMVREADRQILQLITAQWTESVTRELSRLRGKADLLITVERRLIQMAGHVSIPLVVHNNGHSPADHVELKLRKNSDFAVIGSNSRTFDSIATEGSQETSFTIRPLIASPQLVFDLQYTDAEAAEKELIHSERIEIRSSPRAWTPISNPYNSGTPIRDSRMFYGRQDDVHILQEKLTNTPSNSVVVLSGQRRSGKTSLLYQLVNTEVLQPHIPVFIDMHGEGMEFTPTRFFSHIAHFIYLALKKQGLLIAPPDSQALKEDLSFTFRLFLEEVEEQLKGRKLVLLIDEFEILEEKMKENSVASEISQYFRSLIQHGQGVSFLLSGTRKIRELTGDYWSILFNIARQHRLSQLSERGAIQLITEPAQQYLQYDASALREIRRLTADQPYFIHLLCSHLVDHCNEIEQSYVTVDDINAVLDNVLETCHNHFAWMWNQSPIEGQLMLSALIEAAGGEDHPLSLMDIEDVYHHHAIPHTEPEVLQALEYLMREEIVEGTVAGEVTEVASSRMLCHIPVGLARLWIRRFKPLKG